MDNVRVLVSTGAGNSVQYAAIASIRYPQADSPKDGFLEKVICVVTEREIPLHTINAWCYHDSQTDAIKPVILYRVDKHGEYTMRYEDAKELIESYQQLSCELFYEMGVDDAGDPWLTDSLDKIREMQERNNHDQCK